MFSVILQGCVSDPETGFQYLQKAAESVVHDLDKVVTGQLQLSHAQMEEQTAKVCPPCLQGFVLSSSLASFLS